MSVLEVLYCFKEFDDIIKGVECYLRDLMGILDNYKVIFL